jgi:hypothetical protein
MLSVHMHVLFVQIFLLLVHSFFKLEDSVLIQNHMSGLFKQLFLKQKQCPASYKQIFYSQKTHHMLCVHVYKEFVHVFKKHVKVPDKCVHIHGKLVHMYRKYRHVHKEFVQCHALCKQLSKISVQSYLLKGKVIKDKKRA